MYVVCIAFIVYRMIYKLNNQAVSHRLPTAEAPVWSQVRYFEFVVDKMELGQVFSKYFGFPHQFLFHHMMHTRLPSGADTIGQLVADVPSGHSLTPPHPKQIKVKSWISGSLLKNNAYDLYSGRAWFESWTLQMLLSSMWVIAFIGNKGMNAWRHIG
jgi:hypothetical protein